MHHKSVNNVLLFNILWHKFTLRYIHLHFLFSYILSYISHIFLEFPRGDIRLNFYLGTNKTDLAPSLHLQTDATKTCCDHEGHGCNGCSNGGEGHGCNGCNGCNKCNVCNGCNGCKFNMFQLESIYAQLKLIDSIQYIHIKCNIIEYMLVRFEISILNVI